MQLAAVLRPGRASANAGGGGRGAGQLFVICDAQAVFGVVPLY